MSRRGFAVIGVVWLLVVLVAAGLTVNASVRVGLARSRNRLLLNRAEWAREACAAILRGRYRLMAATGNINPSKVVSDTIDLGRGTWCMVQVGDPAARINLNLVDSVVLERLLGDSILVDRILRSRPLESVDQVGETLDSAGRAARTLRDFTSVRGTGRVNLNSAPFEVLQAITGLPGAAIDRILLDRRGGRLIAALGEVGTGRIEGGSGGLHEALARVTLGPDQLTAEVVGGVRGSPLRARVVLTLAPMPDRLAVLRRESE
jgi:hypothetical protein